MTKLRQELHRLNQARKHLAVAILTPVYPESGARMRLRIRRSIHRDNMRSFWKHFVDLSWQEGLPL